MSVETVPRGTKLIETPKELRAEIESEWVWFLISENEGREYRADEARLNLKELLAQVGEFDLKNDPLVLHVTNRLAAEDDSEKVED